MWLRVECTLFVIYKAGYDLAHWGTRTPRTERTTRVIDIWALFCSSSTLIKKDIWWNIVNYKWYYHSKKWCIYNRISVLNEHVRSLKQHYIQSYIIVRPIKNDLLIKMSRSTMDRNLFEEGQFFSRKSLLSNKTQKLFFVSSDKSHIFTSCFHKQKRSLVLTFPVASW